MIRLATTTSAVVISLSLFLLICMSFFFLLQTQKLPQLKTVESLSHRYSDAYKRMFLIPHPDGLVSRIIPVLFPTAATSTALCYKDAVINHVNHTWARLFLHKSGSKLPILVFVHGGGFVNGGAADPVHQSLCANAAGRLDVLIVSVYRLAPEHRLPVVYDDVLEALTWVRDG